MKYRVEVYERWLQAYEVEADSPEEARALVLDEGIAIDNDQEYVDFISVRDAADAVTEIKEEENTAEYTTIGENIRAQIEGDE